MPRKNKLKAKEATKRWKKKHPEKVRAINKRYRADNPDKIKAKRKRYRAKYRERMLQYMKEYQQRLKLSILKHYSAENPFCACCGEREMAFLSIDHINGGGTQHRRTIGRGKRFYVWLKQKGFPKGYQVMCFNCNVAKGLFGVCPHKIQL